MKSSTRLSGAKGSLAMVQDGLLNVATGMGTGADKNSYTRWQLGTRNNDLSGMIDHTQVAAAYMTDWLTAKVHDIPPEEMTKAWRNWQAKDTDITILEAEEKRLKLRDQTQDALREGLFGGGAMIMGLPGRSSDPAPPPEEVGAGGLRYIWTVSRYQLSYDQLEDDLDEENFGLPRSFILNGQRQQRIHPSRIIIFPGDPVPKSPLLRKDDRFWGRPRLERINSAMQNARLAQDAVAELIHQLKKEIITIPGLTELLSTPDGEAKLLRRLQVAALMGAEHDVTLLDGGEPGVEKAAKEEWDTRQLSFANLPEAVMTYIQMAAGANDIPLTRVVGTQAKGLNNDGGGDEKNFLSSMRSRQNTQLRPRLERLDPYLKASAGVKESVRNPILWKFGPLVEMSPLEEAQIDKEFSEFVLNMAQAAILEPDALNKITKNKMIERQTFPGAEQAFAEASEPIPAVREAELAEQSAQAANENEAKKINIAARGGGATGSVQRRRANDSSIQDAEPRPLYVSRKVMNPQELLRWARAAGIPNLEPASELHVTVAFSKAAVDWMKVPTDWSGDQQGRLRIPPGGPRLVERFGLMKDTLVLTFNDDHLRWRHQAILDAGASWDWPEYQPHITLAAKVPADFDVEGLAPYTGRIVLGPEIFQEIVENYYQTR